MPDTPALIERLEAAVATFDPDDGDYLANRAVVALLPDLLATLRSDAAMITGLREQVRVLRDAVGPFAIDGALASATFGDLRRASNAYAATESEG